MGLLFFSEGQPASGLRRKVLLRKVSGLIWLIYSIITGMSVLSIDRQIMCLTRILWPDYSKRADGVWRLREMIIIFISMGLKTEYQLKTLIFRKCERLMKNLEVKLREILRHSLF